MKQQGLPPEVRREAAAHFETTLDSPAVIASTLRGLFPGFGPRAITANRIRQWASHGRWTRPRSGHRVAPAFLFGHTLPQPPPPIAPGPEPMWQSWMQ